MSIIKKIFKNKFFYVYLFLLFLINYQLFVWDVRSFFWIWNVQVNKKVLEEDKYIAEYLLDDTAIYTFFANLEYWNSNYRTYDILLDSISEIKSSENIANIDIIWLLESSPNKIVVYESHYNQVQNQIDIMNNLLDSVKEIVDEKKVESQSCETLKTNSDTQFFMWVKNNDIDILVDWLEWSLESWPCYIENRIKSRAYAIVYNKMVFYRNILERKHDLLMNNQDQILQNYQLFKNNVLSELQDINSQIIDYDELASTSIY